MATHLAIIACTLFFNSLFSASVLDLKAFMLEDTGQIDLVQHLGLDYKTFTTNVEYIYRACSTRLLTRDAKFAAMQQNTHLILRLIFDDYSLTETYLDDDDSDNELPKISSESDADALDIFNKRFICFDSVTGNLLMAKVLRKGLRRTPYLRYYHLKIQMPSSIGILYGKMIAKSINLNFVLRLFPRIKSSIELSFKITAPTAPDLTNRLNALVKEFICKSFQAKNKKIEQPSVSIMEHLAEEFFKKGLGVELYIGKQGDSGFLYTHIVSKPCMVYEKYILPGIGYSKDRIKFIEQFKMPVCPTCIGNSFRDKVYYCIYTYNSNKDHKLNDDSSKKYRNKTAASLIAAAMPLMRVPEGTTIVIYLVFSKDRLVDLLNKKQASDFIRSKDIDKNQSSRYASSSSSSTMSDDQLCIFMNHFANYLGSKNNKTLFEIDSQRNF